MKYDRMKKSIKYKCMRQQWIPTQTHAETETHAHFYTSVSQSNFDYDVAIKR